MNGTTQAQADANTPPQHVLFTDMLTVWRKLHVEVDSMAAEPTTLPARDPDWDQFDAIELLAGEATTIFTGIGLMDGPGLAAGEADHYEGGLLSYTTPARNFPIRFNQSILTAEGWRAEIRVDGAVSPAEEWDLLSNVGDVRDDDPVSGQLPLLYAVGADPFIKSAYEAAYIAIEQDDAMNPRREVSFDLHLDDWELQTGVGYDNSQDVFSENAYWASLVVLAYQPKEAVDADPDPFAGQNNSGAASNPNYDEKFDFGITVEDSDNASVIYVEVQRDVGSPPASPMQHDLAHTIAHEMGHAAGPPNDARVEHNGGGLMSSGAPVSECCFTAQTLRRFRETIRW